MRRARERFPPLSSKHFAPGFKSNTARSRKATFSQGLQKPTSCLELRDREWPVKLSTSCLGKTPFSLEQERGSETAVHTHTCLTPINLTYPKQTCIHIATTKTLHCTGCPLQGVHREDSHTATFTQNLSPQDNQTSSAIHTSRVLTPDLAQTGIIESPQILLFCTV